MLERLLTRQRIVSGTQILAGVVAVAFSIELAYAQSPAAMGVYNRANSSFGSGVSQEINPLGMGSTNTGVNPMQMGSLSMGTDGLTSGTISTKEEWKPMQVNTPEYVYHGHEADQAKADQAITSLQIFPWEIQKSKNGQYESYSILSSSCDKTARLWQLEGEFDQETGEFTVTGGRVLRKYEGVHRQGLTSATVSPDYKYVLTSSYDGIGRLWNIKSAENTKAYLGAKDRLWTIKVSDSGEYVAAACNDGRVYFWEPLTVKKLATLPNREDAFLLGEGHEEDGHEGPVFDVSFSPDSDYVATAGADGTVRIWNLRLLRQVSVIQAGDDKIYSVQFSDDGNYLLTAGRDKSARMFNAATGEEVCRFVGHTGAVRKAIFAGNYVVTCGDDQTARIWSTSATNELNSRNNTRGASNGSRMMGGSSVEYGSMGYGSMGSESGYPGSNAGRNGEKAEATGKPTREPGKPKGTELVCFNTGSAVFSVAISSDLVYVVTGGADGLAKVWHVPGYARYYGDSQSAGNNGSYNSSKGSGYGYGSGYGTNVSGYPNTTRSTNGRR